MPGGQIAEVYLRDSDSFCVDRANTTSYRTGVLTHTAKEVTFHRPEYPSASSCAWTRAMSPGSEGQRDLECDLASWGTDPAPCVPITR